METDGLSVSELKKVCPLSGKKTDKGQTFFYFNVFYSLIIIHGLAVDRTRRSLHGDTE